MNRFDLGKFQQEFEPHGSKSALEKFINDKGQIKVTRYEIESALALKNETDKTAKILNYAVDFLELRKREEEVKRQLFASKLNTVADRYEKLKS